MAKKNSFYRKEVIKQLYFRKALSCADISDKIGKSLPLTTKIITELVEDEYVIETGYAASTGGRRPQIYSLRDDFMYIVSVAMDQFVTRIAIMDIHNRIVSDIEKFELPLYKNDKALSILSEKVKTVIEKSGIDKEKIAGVGIGMPGFVNIRQGINYSYLNADDNINIADHIAGIIDLPVYIDNDSTLVALAELKFGSLHGKKNVMVINIGWGIGLGLIIKGELFRGKNGFAGEFSHLPLFANGKLCTCGKSGCLDTEASLSNVIEKTIEGLKEGQLSILDLNSLEKDHPEKSCEAIIEAARKGDRFAVKIFSEAGYNIGRGIAILIHLLNPDLFILSGRGSVVGRIWEAPMQHSLNEHCIPRLAAGTEIQVSDLGSKAELIGAAALVMENFDKEVSGNFLRAEKKIAG